MKLFISLLLFQTCIQFTFGQNVGHLNKEESQKELEQQFFPGSRFQDDFQFEFQEPFTELNFLTADGYKLNLTMLKF